MLGALASECSLFFFSQSDTEARNTEKGGKDWEGDKAKKKERRNGPLAEGLDGVDDVALGGQERVKGNVMRHAGLRGDEVNVVPRKRQAR